MSTTISRHVHNFTVAVRSDQWGPASILHMAASLHTRASDIGRQAHRPTIIEAEPYVACCSSVNYTGEQWSGVGSNVRLSLIG